MKGKMDCEAVENGRKKEIPGGHSKKKGEKTCGFTVKGCEFT